MATFNFFISISDYNGKPIYSGYRPAELTDKDLKEAAEAMEQNGGYASDLSDLGMLSDTAGEQIIDGLIDLEELADIDDWDDFSIDFDNSIPDDLMKAIERFLTKRSVDFKVDCVKDGKPTSTFVNMPISQKVFNKMVEIAGEPHPDLNDLAFLKLKGYDEYEELMPELDRRLNELQSSGTFDSISYNGDFPYQVYENL